MAVGVGQVGQGLEHQRRRMDPATNEPYSPTILDIFLELLIIFSIQVNPVDILITFSFTDVF